MKTVRIAGYILGLTILITLPGSSKVYAQAEIDPDHYETTDAAPTAAMHYAGKVKLPHTLRCEGQSLPPGEYSMTVNSDREIAHVTLLRMGQAFRLQGIAQRQNHPSRNALVVERDGGLRRLSLIHASQMELKFGGGIQHKSGDRRGTIETLALFPANSAEAATASR